MDSINSLNRLSCVVIVCPLLYTMVSCMWHRLLVDRPGRYTVRLTVIFYHNDKRRGDGIVLGLDDLIEVSQAR